MATPSTTPVANPDTAATTDAAAVTVNVLVNDADPDSTETLTLAGASIASGQGSVSIVSGRLVYDPGTAYRALDAGQSATVSIGYTIADTKGLTAQSTLSVTVNGVNQAPTATGAKLQGTGDTQVISAAALLAGASDPEGQSLTVASASGGVHGTATLNADGSVTFQRRADFGGTASFSYSVSDGHGGTSYATAQVGYQAFAASGEPAGAIRSIATGAVLDAVLTPDGKNLIVDRSDGSISEYSLATGAPTASWTIGGVKAMSVTPDGKYLVAVGGATAFNINLETGAVASAVNRDFHQPTFNEIVGTADGKAVFGVTTSSPNESLSTYDPAANAFGTSLNGSYGATSVVMTGSADGTRFLLNTNNGSTNSALIEYVSGNPTKIAEVDSSVAAPGVVAIANGAAFAAQVTNGLFLYDSQLHLLANLAFLNPDVAELDKASYAGLAFSPDGRALYALDITGDQIIRFSTADYTVQALLPIGVDATVAATAGTPSFLQPPAGAAYGDRLEISAEFRARFPPLRRPMAAITPTCPRSAMVTTTWRRVPRRSCCA